MSSQPPYRDGPYSTGLLHEAPTTARADARAVFGQVMFMVAVALAFTAGGAYIGRNLSFGWAIACWVGSFALILGMSFARKAQAGAVGMALLYGVGLLLGMAVGPTLAEYASSDGGGTIISQAAGLTALFIGVLGSIGYATRRDLSGVARMAFFALIGLLAFGIIAMFVSIPGANLLWSVLGLVIFGAFTMYDFQRLRTATEDDAVMIALGIFLDVFNVFLFILNLLGMSRD
jgi:FtsH-binding integral membrane protein